MPVPRRLRTALVGAALLVAAAFGGALAPAAERAAASHSGVWIVAIGPYGPCPAGYYPAYAFPVYDQYGRIAYWYWVYCQHGLF